MRLAKPHYTVRCSLYACSQGVPENNSLQGRLVVADEDMDRLESGYITCAENGAMFTLDTFQNLPREGPEGFRGIAQIEKSELVAVYNTYFRGKSKPARKIYDYLLILAQDKCPYCGGIGRPKNLDHYMPKAHFTQFSILPLNLIPACLDCNLGSKASGYANTAEDQIIHPYLDGDRFFNEQWVFAKVVQGDPSVIEYYVQAPNTWSDIDKKRVEKHFKEFDLGKRYSCLAADELSALVPQWKAFFPLIGIDGVKSCLLEPVVESGVFPNDWKRVMYQAIFFEGLDIF
ncbi:MAG: hypothetical protein ACI9D5_001172 [Candidatus Endobugula sp.]|jgi:hypothetical protein